MQGFWNRLKARWYRKGLDYSDFADAALSVILPKTEGAKTFLDVGAGCGSLSVPLAKAGKKVTAIDPAVAMIEILKEDIEREGLGKRITPMLSVWDAAKVRPHDVVLCANVPELLKKRESPSSPGGFLKEADATAKKAVFIIVNADPKADKFYYRELYPLLFKKEFVKEGDYLTTYAALHDIGIYANIEMIEYDFDQPFDSIEEAVEFWKEYLGIVTEEHDAALSGFLSKKLVRKKGVLLARFHKKSAVIWWKKAKGGTKR